MIQGNLDGASTLCDEVFEKLQPTYDDKSSDLIEFYKTVIESYESAADSHSVELYVQKYKLKLADYLFDWDEFEEAIKLIDEVNIFCLKIVSMVSEKATDSNLALESCVKASLVEIWRLGTEAQEKVDEFCMLSNEFEQSYQYILVKRILESVRNGNQQELENAVMRI
ncbi:hypothetical protein RF11_05284 [Thelohanellus kitauei]|uniref:Uncharacterized protein n=1 Tax=Thelohanellus kitauei TaxID=669202 RepID=A0A0C2IUF6_THEKT|nr:hypothetical protein RF11_05284 [Thelohanellus kitauei]